MATDRLTWIGHATVLLEMAEHRVLTDPLLTRRVAHLRRRCPLPDASITDVDVVLVTHLHMDHLHLRSLRRIRPGARVIAPTGSVPLLRSAGVTSWTEVAVGDRVEHGPLTIDVVPARHGSGRGPHSRVTADPVGYVVGAGERRHYVAGDTDLFDEMADLGVVDVAFLPIWGWGPTIGSGHLDPARAAVATELIRPRVVVPVHWGTYAPEDVRRRLPSWFEGPMHRFDDELRAAGLHSRLQVVRPGEVVDDRVRTSADSPADAR